MLSTKKLVMKHGTWNGRGSSGSEGVNDLAPPPEVGALKLLGLNPKTHSLAAWCRRVKKLSKCTHEGESHSVTASEVVEVCWTGGEGIDSAVSLLNETFNKEGV